MIYFILVLGAVGFVVTVAPRTSQSIVTRAILAFARSMDRTSLYQGPRNPQRTRSAGI